MIQNGVRKEDIPGTDVFLSTASLGGWPRRVIDLAILAALAFAIWQAYQQPSFIIDLAAWRLC